MKLRTIKLSHLLYAILVLAVSANAVGANSVDEYRTSLIAEITGSEFEDGKGKPKSSISLTKAIQDFDPEDESRGRAAWDFLRRLSASQTFQSQFWQTRPLLLRCHEIKSVSRSEANWVKNSFTIEKDLRLVDNSFISGSRTDDILRNGTKTDSWAFRNIKPDLTKRTTWAEVKEALDGGTIYFNTAGSFWPSLGALCRLTSYAFGLPTNVNIYITPPGSTISVPPHTDRQDVILFHTAGCKRWRVYNPPKRAKGKDPLNRGKGGDVIEQADLGAPLLDVVLRKGDVMYIPAGFPHTTDTSTVVEEETVPAEDSDGEMDLFKETSVHLTMGLDTHVWALTYAHLRWALLQRCEKDWKVEIHDDEAYWESMKMIPVGFLSGDGNRCIKTNTNHGENAKSNVVENSTVEALKRILIALEPERWGNEVPPSDDDIRQAIRYLTHDHLGSLLDIQEEMYRDVNPCDENTIIKGYQCSQKQNEVMQRFGEFSKNDAMKNVFEQRRLLREQKASGAIN